MKSTTHVGARAAPRRGRSRASGRRARPAPCRRRPRPPRTPSAPCARRRPATATRITRRPPPRPRRPSGCQGLAERVLVGPDAGRRQALGGHSSSASSRRSSSVTASMRSITSSSVEQRHVGEHRGAEPVHARAGRLQREHHAALDVLLGPLELLAGGRLLAHALELCADHPQRLGQVVRARAQVEADLPGVGVLVGERVDRVGQAAPLAHLLEQARGRGAAEDVVEHAQGEAAVVVAGDPRRAEAHVVLLGVLALEAHVRARGRRAGGRAVARRARRRAATRARARRAARGRSSPRRRPRCCRAGSARGGTRAMASTGVSRMTSGRPMIARPSGSSPKTASPRTSKTLSCGSSSYMAISSSTTSRSGSTSCRAGRQTMSAITSNARSRWTSSTREYNDVVSLPVPALISAPMASKIWSISSEP